MEKSKFKILLQLFFDYFKVGLFTFGGGLSMIPLIERTFVEKRQLITKDELLSIISIAESTPGVIAVNIATYLGYKVRGVLGSIISTIAVILPSLIIISIISFFYEQFIQIEIIKYLFNGLIIGATILIFRAGISVYKTYKKNWLGYVLIGVSFVLVFLIRIMNLNISTIYVILGGGLIYLIYYLIATKVNKTKKEEEQHD